MKRGALVGENGAQLYPLKDIASKGLDKPVKLLITGGAGFIGTNFVRYMVNKYPEYAIVNLDLLTYAGNLENLKDIEDAPNYKFVKGDIADRDFVNHLFAEEQFDYVLNFAAESHVDRSIANPAIFVRTNIQGSQVLLDAAKNFKVKKYLQVSTDEVYGSLGTEGMFTEATPLAPNNPYSASKASADFLVCAYHETFGLPVNITRCSNNYGFFQFPEKLIPLMITHALKGKSLPVYGDGLDVRDWLHVEDHCHAVDLVLHKGRNGEIYNVGGNNERTNIEIVKRILKYLGKPESLIKFVDERPGGDYRYAIDANKLRTELGWKPKHNFDTGIEQTIKWYLENQEWWENIILGEYESHFEKQYGKRLKG